MVLVRRLSILIMLMRPFLIRPLPQSPSNTNPATLPHGVNSLKLFSGCTWYAFHNKTQKYFPFICFAQLRHHQENTVNTLSRMFHLPPPSTSIKYNSFKPYYFNFNFPRSVTRSGCTLIPRAFSHSSTGFNFHGFCDAFTKGYAAVLHLFLTAGSNQSHSSFGQELGLEVAPLKPLSLPQL